jgi:aminopeptidase N
MVVDFRLAYASRGFTSSAEPVAGNGSYLSTGLLFPVVGYRRGYELTEPAERRRHGLPRSARERAREAPQHDRLESPDWTEFDVTVSTAADEMVVAPGALLNTRTEGSRRWFHFHTGSAIPHQYVIASARYSVSRTMHAGVAVEVYHHPAHTQNVGRIVRAATDALNDLGASFGAYPHRELRIAEVPERFRNFSGFAEPGVVFLGERRGFLIDTRDPARLDLVYRRVAHEVAHQWWGYSLVPAAVPGATTLTESLTKYSELKMLENHYGREEVRRSLEYELDLYLSGRTTETGTEPPLSRAEQQSYLYYRKGALVLHGLGKVLGPSATDAALRSLLRKHGGPGGRATADDLTAELKAASPPPFHDLIDQWMNEVVLYDVAVVSAEARPSPAGSEEYEVTLTVDAAKRRVRGAVMEELPLSEPFLVMVFSPAGDTEPRPLHTARHLLRQGRQTVVVRVHGTPGSAVVDPYLTRIDSNQTDNQRAVRVR